jgi:DNA-binding MarR family transcriptional regulator
MELGFPSMTEKNDDLILEKFIPYRLSVLSNTVSNSIASLYADRFGLSIPAWRLMAVLAHFSGLSAAEAADRTEMDKVAVSRAVSGLLKSGYISRSFASDDRRRSVLELTEKGREIYRQIVPLALSYERQFIEALSPEAKEHLDKLLDELTEKAQSLARNFR